MHWHHNWISCTTLCSSLVWGANIKLEDSPSSLTWSNLIPRGKQTEEKDTKKNTPKQNLIFWEQYLNKRGEKQKGKRSHAAKGGGNKTVTGNIESTFVFPCVCFNHSSLYLVRRSAYLRQCDENKVAVSARLCCPAAFLSCFFFLALP